MTGYRSTTQQTDDSPFYTSTGEHVQRGGAAVSRDLLCGACRKLHHRCLHPDYPSKLHYGDWLYIRDAGFLRVNDVMGAYTRQRVKGKIVRIPITEHIDVWMAGLNEERAFHKRWKGKTVELYRVEEK